MILSYNGYHPIIPDELAEKILAFDRICEAADRMPEGEAISKILGIIGGYRTCRERNTV